MARREININRRCVHEGCKDVAWHRFKTRREYKEWSSGSGKKPYLCLRHKYPGEVLGIENTKTEKILIAGKSKTYPDLEYLFWGDGSGYCHGPGFQAHADEFPEGTILKVTAEIILPE